MTNHVTIVVPLYNEADRWNEADWRELVSIPLVRWLFVDDGSTDNTHDLVTEFLKSSQAQLLTLQVNQGKGNAVREGMLVAWKDPGLGIGFMDGDGAFHRDDIQALVEILLHPDAISNHNGAWDSVWGSRVALAGRDIRRRSTRHYIGRVIATIISQGLSGVPYDTQCGLKIFSPSPQLLQCINRPFVTDWFFDVEILQRWIEASGRPMKTWEQPLMHWHDVPGSKITAKSGFKVAREIAYASRRNRTLPR